MEITPRYIRTLSMLGQRGTYGVALLKAAQNNEDIVALSADLCNTSGLDRFKTSYPDRFYNTGISEQNMIGVAAGLAAGGNIPFASTFANFAALRSCEQIRHFMGYMRENVKVVALSAGFAMGMFGNTHYGMEDIAAIRAINNIVILSPADGLEVVKSVEAAVRIKAPVYIRLTGVMNMPVIYKDDYHFEPGKAVKLKEGLDVAIFATGSMVYNALKAAEQLEAAGISTSVTNMHTIKPLDVKSIYNACSAKLIATIEEHSKIGGLGSAVAETIAARKTKPPLLVIGTGEQYLNAGDYKYLINQYSLSADKIFEKIKSKYWEIIK